MAKSDILKIKFNPKKCLDKVWESIYISRHIEPLLLKLGENYNYHPQDGVKITCGDIDIKTINIEMSVNE